VNAEYVDRLVASIAPVTDESLREAVRSEEARLLFDRILSTPAEGSRRRRRMLVAAVVAAALVAAPALALHGRIVHVFAAAEEAPPPVAASFFDLERGAPARWSISASARLVLKAPTPDGPVSIWAAPRQEGFCYAVGTAGEVGFASTCVDGTEEVDVWPFSVDRPKEDLIGGPFVLVGYTTETKAESVDVRFENGQHTAVPLAWVSPPVDAAFFVAWTGKSHWVDGKERFDVTARDGSGKSLATSAVEVGVPTG
jgi:hypothetical protein